eukprot:4833864-Prymnesium_polylepis.1
MSSVFGGTARRAHRSGSRAPMSQSPPRRRRKGLMPLTTPMRRPRGRGAGGRMSCSVRIGHRIRTSDFRRAIAIAHRICAVW